MPDLDGSPMIPEGIIAWRCGPRVFVAQDERVKLTLVRLGQAPGKKPFLEVHNPTDEPITAEVHSPAHAPLFGGFRQTVEIPAGDSIRIDKPGN